MDESFVDKLFDLPEIKKITNKIVKTIKGEENLSDTELSDSETGRSETKNEETKRASHTLHIAISKQVKI